MDSITVRFNILKRKKEVDLVIPSFITANELIVALNEAYQLNIDTSDITECYLQAENPITLLRGNKTVEEFGWDCNILRKLDGGMYEKQIQNFNIQSKCL